MIGPLRLGRSLHQKLLVPFLAAALVVSLGSVFDIERQSRERLEWELSQRAELLASLVSYSADSITAPGGLQRVVTEASGEADVLDIVVAAGSPAMVVASTRPERVGQPLTAIDDDVRDHLQRSIDGGRRLHHFNDGTITFDFGAPLVLAHASPDTAELAHGAVLVRMDTRRMRAVILQSTLRSCFLAVADVLLVTALAYALLRRVVLRPVAAIGVALRRHNERDDQAWTATELDDELGALARTLRESLAARARTEAALRLSERMAAIGALASGVAHEINTPVQFVGDSVHFLRDAVHDTMGLMADVQALAVQAAAGAPDEAVRRAVVDLGHTIDAADLPYLLDHIPRAFDRCTDGLERVTHIVRSMKESADLTERDVVPADLNRAIRNSLTLARNEYKYVADIQTDLQDLPPVTCRVSDIHQVVLHLIVHAAHAIAEVVKGSGRKGIITVGTVREGDAVVLRVQHTGAPPPDGHLPSDASAASFTAAAAASQGLALAWRIVSDGHHGTLRIERADDRTVFIVRLPIAGPHAQPQPGVAA